MIEEFFVSIAILGALIASFTDLKKGIIPNKLTFPLTFLGLAGYFSYSLYIGDLSLLVLTIENVVIIFIIGYLFWILGGWSAGDAKEFLFIAALIPKYPEFLAKYLNPALPPYPFILSILANTFIAIFPFILLFSISKTNPRRFLEPLKNISEYALISLIFVSGIVISKESGVSILGVLYIIFLYRLRNSFAIPLSLLITLAYLVTNITEAGFIFSSYLLVLVVMIIFGIFWNSIKLLRREALQETIKISNLQEGMIPAEEIYIKGEDIIREERSLSEKILNAVKNGNISELRRKGISMGAAGLTQKEVEMLKDLVRRGKMEDRIKIKKSMPFAPVIAIGLTISLLLGDIPTAIRVLLYG